MTWRNRRRETSDCVDQVAAASFVTESGHLPERGSSVLEGIAAVSATDVWGRADHRAYLGTISSVVPLTLVDSSI
jgi:hypothetical protein